MGALSFVAKVAVIVALPFLLLLRGSVLAWRDGGMPAWLALVLGATLATLVLTAYAAWLSTKVSGTPGIGTMAKWIVIPVVTLYCGFGVLHLSRDNAKSDEIRAHYRALHPLLRVALHTLILADANALVTDHRRRPADYAQMGLASRPLSRHYRQTDGYVHAVDIRTRGRSAIRNLLLEGYFRAVGLKTLRHVGTADHLHVSLPIRALPH